MKNITSISTILIFIFLGSQCFGQQKIFDLESDFGCQYRDIKSSPNGDKLILSKILDFGITSIQTWELSGTEYIQTGDFQSTIQSAEMLFSEDHSRIFYLYGNNNANTNRATIIVNEIDGSQLNQLGEAIEEQNIEGNFNTYDFSGDGNTIVVGDHTQETAYITAYNYNGTSWEQKGESIIFDESPFLMELTLSFDGNRMVSYIKPALDSIDKVVIYDLIDNQWQISDEISDIGTCIQLDAKGETIYSFKEDKFFLEHREVNGVFELARDALEIISRKGQCRDIDVSANGEHAIIGTVNTFNGADDGSVSMIQKINGQWVERQNLLYQLERDDYFGFEVEISEDGSRAFIASSQNGGGILGIKDSRFSGHAQIISFIDLNGNGQLDNTERALPTMQYNINEEWDVVPDQFGVADLYLTEGPYSIKPILPENFEDEPAIDINVMAGLSDTFYIPLEPVSFAYANGIDVPRHLCNSRQELKIDLTNYGLSDIESELIMTYNIIDSLTHENILVSESLGFLWIESDTLAYGESYEYRVAYNVPAEDYIGDTVHIYLTLNVREVDGTQVDIVRKYSNGIIRCSWDPNDKAVDPMGFTENAYTPKDQTLSYKVRFQNTGNFPASTVAIQDEISPELDIRTLRVIDTSHPLTETFYEGNIVNFVFENINLPDSTSNEPESHGHVLFDIDPFDDLPESTVIENTALIFFDLNAPIVTNTVMNTMITDMDADQSILEFDCDDNNPDINPSAAEIPGNGIDEDCDGLDGPSSTSQIAAINIEVYPNPASDIITIDVDGLSNFEVKLFDLNGDLILKHKNQRLLQTTNIPNGLYLIQIKDYSTGQKFIKKVVIGK